MLGIHVLFKFILSTVENFIQSLMISETGWQTPTPKTINTHKRPFMIGLKLKLITILLPFDFVIKVIPILCLYNKKLLNYTKYSLTLIRTL